MRVRHQVASLVRTKSARKFQFDLSTDLWPFSCPKYLSDFVEIRWEQKLALETATPGKLLINSVVTDHSWRFTRNARQIDLCTAWGRCDSKNGKIFFQPPAAPCLSGARRPHWVARKRLWRQKSVHLFYQNIFIYNCILKGKEELCSKCERGPPRTCKIIFMLLLFSFRFLFRKWDSCHFLFRKWK